MSARKQIAAVVFVAAVVIGSIAAARTFLRNELEPVGVGAKAPDFSVMTLDSVPQTRTFADYRGKVLLINIWATWCGPCRVEMPSIEQLHRAYGTKGLKVLAMSVDEPGTDAEIRNFVSEYGLTFEVLHDPQGQEGNVAKNFQTNGYPETVIVGRDGIIRKKFLGAHNWNSEENRRLIDRLLAEEAD